MTALTAKIPRIKKTQWTLAREFASKLNADNFDKTQVFINDEWVWLSSVVEDGDTYLEMVSPLFH